MKKIISCMFMFVVFGLLLAGCGDSPKDVAKKYMQALEKGDVTEANKYSTERTQALNGLIVPMLNQAKKEAGDKDTKNEFKESLEKIDDARTEIDGDNAKLYLSDDDKEPITLKKVDGDWKVDVEK